MHITRKKNIYIYIFTYKRKKEGWNEGEREKQKEKERYITQQLRKFINLPIRPGTNALLEIGFPVCLAFHLSPFVSFSRLRQVERMECGCVYDILSGSGTRSKTFRSCKIHRIYKLCRTADKGAGFEMFARRDDTWEGTKKRLSQLLHVWSTRSFNEILTRFQPSYIDHSICRRVSCLS